MKVTCTLTLVLAAGTIVLLADTARAQNSTWCALLDGDEQQCNYNTQQECLETVSGVGGVCIESGRRFAAIGATPAVSIFGKCAGTIASSAAKPRSTSKLILREYW